MTPTSKENSKANSKDSGEGAPFIQVPQSRSGTHPVGKDESSRSVGKDELACGLWGRAKGKFAEECGGLEDPSSTSGQEWVRRSEKKRKEEADVKRRKKKQVPRSSG
jgi:hypothetical protein